MATKSSEGLQGPKVSFGAMGHRQAELKLEFDMEHLFHISEHIIIDQKAP